MKNTNMNDRIHSYSAANDSKTFAATVSYLGTNYSGWQRQPESISVQQRFEEALALLGEPVTVVAAGRTDAGVHAVGQVVSFRLAKSWEARRLLLAVNAHLPDDITVTDVQKVEDSFHARYSAKWREYRYFVYHGSSCLAPIRPLVWWNRWNWDLNAVRQACRLLVGTHDFRAFCKTTECPENSMRTLLRVSCHKVGRITMIQIRGESFLNNMVRIIVGNLDRIGQKKCSIEWFSSLLRGVCRNESSMTVPASGLFFWHVGYK